MFANIIFTNVTDPESWSSFSLPRWRFIFPVNFRPCSREKQQESKKGTKTREDRRTQEAEGVATAWRFYYSIKRCLRLCLVSLTSQWQHTMSRNFHLGGSGLNRPPPATPP